MKLYTENIEKINFEPGKPISSQYRINEPQYVQDFLNLKKFIEDERIRRNKPDLNYHIYKELQSLLRDYIPKNSQSSQSSRNSRNSQYPQSQQYSQSSRNSQYSQYSQYS